MGSEVDSFPVAHNEGRIRSPLLRRLRRRN